MLETMNKIKIKQIRSAINRPERQKRTLKALGIKKMQQTIEVNDTPQIRGMINKVNHLLLIEKI
jgi:large subunit ribosomal protein L30